MLVLRGNVGGGLRMGLDDVVDGWGNQDFNGSELTESQLVPLFEVVSWEGFFRMICLKS